MGELLLLSQAPSAHPIEHEQWNDALAEGASPVAARQT
jgi:hypothetical protein